MILEVFSNLKDSMITEGRCFHVVFASEVLSSFGAQSRVMLLQLPGSIPVKGVQPEVLGPSSLESIQKALWDSDAEHTMVAVLLGMEGFNIYGVCGREREKSNRNAGFILCAGTNAC